jgi:hypothetical protein
MASEDKRWKIDLACHHLKGQKLRLKFYKRWSESWDHDHCLVCAVTFAEWDDPNDPDIQHEGYATTEDYKHGADYTWVCVKCFAELKDDLGWIVIP